MKKNVVNKVAFTLVMLSLLCAVTGTAFAAGADDFAASVGIVSPRYATIRRFYADLTISSSGQASCHVAVSLYGSYRGEVTMYLQQRSGGWQTIEFWPGTGDGCDESYYVLKGDSYRVKGDLRVYDNSGKLVESATTYSETIFY